MCCAVASAALVGPVTRHLHSGTAIPSHHLDAVQAIVAQLVYLMSRPDGDRGSRVVVAVPANALASWRADLERWLQLYVAKPSLRWQKDTLTLVRIHAHASAVSGGNQ